jgi:hypothetical protein
VFVRRKDFERDFARRLRARGHSLRIIAAELGVALSSVSVWVRDVPVPPTTDGQESRPKASEREERQNQLRRCGRCGVLLPASAFNRSGDGYQWWCRECFREYFRRRGDLHRKQCRAGKRKRRKRAKAFIREYLTTHPCADCGESDQDVLELDHIGEKKGHLSRLAYHGYSVEVLATEMRACEVVCVNCHRRRTARRSGSRRAANWRDAPAPLQHTVARNFHYAYTRLEASGCVDCALNEICVLDFDHVGQKRANVLSLARGGCGLERLIEEIEQCEVRCANCHRRRTARQRRASTIAG